MLFKKTSDYINQHRIVLNYVPLKAVLSNSKSTPEVLGDERTD
jgi:hypothetical protein